MFDKKFKYQSLNIQEEDRKLNKTIQKNINNYDKKKIKKYGYCL